MIIHKKCHVCGKLAQVKSSVKIGGLTLKTYTCGHVATETGLKRSEYDCESEDGKRPYPFQLKGAEFAAQSNARCLILDEMGLGKTIQALLVMKAHPELRPFLVLCKSGLRIQWMKEIIRWCGMDFLPQVIEGSKDYLIPGFKSYVVSLDLLRRLPNGDNDIVKRLGIQSVIIDEVQQIKNSQSKRTNEVRSICKQVEHIIGLSGTPIKNHAGEYFPILNIMRPEQFPREQTFLWSWTESYWDGYKCKTGGLRNPARFMEVTKDFIIRRTREEVLPELPSITRDFRFCDLGSTVEQAYKDTFKEFQDYYNGASGDSEFVRASNILAYLSKMRHLTGIAKVEPCLEFIQDFLEETDRKLTVFVHHKDVGLTLLTRLQEWCKRQELPEPLSLTADMNADKRSETVDKFWNNGNRLMIASTLASGEGLNLQCASDCILLERQWNPANEEQAECRFIRIGQTAEKVSASYFVAVGTVDEFFSELVERKRQIVSETLDGHAVKWDESSLMRELAETLAAKGGKKWGW